MKNTAHLSVVIALGLASCVALSALQAAPVQTGKNAEQKDKTTEQKNKSTERKAAAANPDQQQMRDLDEQVQQTKSDVLSIAAELNQLEEKLLYPSGTQVAIFVRTSQGPAALTPALVREIHALDANLAPYEVITLREQLDRSTSPQRVAVTLLTLFGMLAVLLAGIGLYGVMAYAVSQSRRELGLRMALGAAPMQVLRLVMTSGLAMTMIGIAVGAAAALGSTRLLGYMLYRVSPRDPIAFGAALVVMIFAAILACMLPAWRAARTDPVGALRE